MTERLLRPTEAAQILGISRSKVYALITKGLLPATKVVGSVRIPEQALQDWISANTIHPEPRP